VESRSWTQHLRLLPGGDADVASALIASGILYVVFLVIGWIAASLFVNSIQVDLGPIGPLSLGNTLPCAVIAMWTGLRVRGTKHIGVEEAAADLKRKRVFYGDEVARVPNAAVVFSIRPRQVTVAMADERALTLFFRVNSDPEDLLTLGRVLSRHPGLAVEDWVHEEAKLTVADMLPDPDGIREAMTSKLLPKGIVVTRVEVG
jgi:hypothetical protein